MIRPTWSLPVARGWRHEVSQSSVGAGCILSSSPRPDDGTRVWADAMGERGVDLTPPDIAPEWTYKAADIFVKVKFPCQE
jgi:hypothetical protein